ncbi:MAG TPA: DUF2807 domain-containing protein, partial [Albitalea sp.]|nr:DUF2807 domain-containing protein [Albitalea sp.]
MISRRALWMGMALSALAVSPWRRAFSAGAASEERPVSGFDEVSWDGAGELLIEQTNREHLAIEAEPAVLAKIVTEVRQRRLHIGFAPGRIDTRLPIRFHLEVKSLVVLETRGSGQVRIGPMNASSLSLLLAGSESLQLARLDAGTLLARLDGSGGVAIGGGEVKSQRVVLAGSGSYAALLLASREADVAIDGSGSVQLAASERLAVRIAGSGSVGYRGDPKL